MIKVVATVFKQTMTELNGDESEKDKIMAITKIVLKPMKQNWHVLLTVTTTNERPLLSSEEESHIDETATA
jgi:hypothetical protein